MSMGFKKDSPSSMTSNSAMISSTTSAPPGSTSPVYANTAASNLANSANNNNQTYAQVRAKLRPTAGFYSQYSGNYSFFLYMKSCPSM